MLGNAPWNTDRDIFYRVPTTAKVYVQRGATGFGQTFKGLQVVTKYINTIAIENGNLLITPYGSTSNIVVEETADLTADNWVTNHNSTVTNGAFQFSTTNSHRYYRFSN